MSASFFPVDLACRLQAVQTRSKSHLTLRAWPGRSEERQYVELRKWNEYGQVAQERGSFAFREPAEEEPELEEGAIVM